MRIEILRRVQKSRSEKIKLVSKAISDDQGIHVKLKVSANGNWYTGTRINEADIVELKDMVEQLHTDMASLKRKRKRKCTDSGNDVADCR